MQTKPSALTATHLLFSSLDGELDEVWDYYLVIISLLDMHFCQQQGHNDCHKPVVKLTFVLKHLRSHVEMTDSALFELKSCCSYATLQALLHLVSIFTEIL